MELLSSSNGTQNKSDRDVLHGDETEPYVGKSTANGLKQLNQRCPTSSQTSVGTLQHNKSAKEDMAAHFLLALKHFKAPEGKRTDESVRYFRRKSCLVARSQYMKEADGEITCEGVRFSHGSNEEDTPARHQNEQNITNNDSTSGTSAIQTLKSDTRLKSTFPVKLFRALLDAKNRNLTDVCSFMPSGKTFRVHDSKRFMTEVASRHFRQTRYPSFLRQLSLYRFRRVVEDKTIDCYSHDFFREARPDLLLNIKREPQAKK